MARVDMGAVAERLLVRFMAPLVLGGPLRPGRPVGGRVALALGEGRTTISDIACLSEVTLARVRVARRLVPVDFLEPPGSAEWALGAVLHDIVQSSHPEWSGLLRGGASAQLLRVAEQTLSRISVARTAAEALSRHAWFSRVFEIGRTDTTVSWWVGSQAFRGADAPSRLRAWPELRRVHVETTVRALSELPESGGRVDLAAFERALAAFLRRTPLTDIATCGRASPAFAWSPDTLGLVATRAGRTLSLRALADARDADVDAALGRAAKVLVASASRPQLLVAMAFMAGRALASCALQLRRGAAPSQQEAGGGADATYGRAMGAWAASRELAADADGAPTAPLDALAPYLTNAKEPTLAPAMALVGSS